jgi:drug/metabolite transporter (DMT)-like permease
MINNQSKGIMYAGFTAVLWGFLAIAIKVALKEIDPITVSWFRFFLAFIFLFVYLSTKTTSHLKILASPPKLVIVGGLGLCLNYIGYISGLHLTSPINAQIIIQLAPVILALIGIVYFKEQVSKKQILGLTLAFIGFIFFYRDQLSYMTVNTTLNYSKGTLYVILGAIFWVVYAVCQKVLVQKYPSQNINLILFLFCSIILFPFIDFKIFSSLTIGMWLLLLFLGLNTLLAYGFLAEAFKYADANKIGIVITLNPIITIATMALLAGMEVNLVKPEILSANGLISAIVVISGAILAVKSK